MASAAEYNMLGADEMAQHREVMAEHAAGVLALSQTGHDLGLRAHQIDPFHKGLEFVVGSPVDQTLTGRYEKPPAFGKSALEVHHASALGFGDPEIQEQVPFGLTGLSLAPTNYLCAQKIASYEQFGPGIRCRREPRFGVVSGGILCTTYAYALQAFRRREFNPRQFDVIYCDEAHHTLGRTILSVLQQMQVNAITIGFTATPAYRHDHTIANTLPHLIDRSTILDGILLEKFLNPIQLYALHSGLSIDTLPRYRRDDFSPAETDHLARNSHRNQLIINAALHGLTYGKGKGIVKCIAGNDQAHAQHIAHLLSRTAHPHADRKIRAVAVGQFEKKSLQYIQEFIRTNRIDVLTYTNLIGEGVDIADLRWGVFGAATVSIAKMIQFVGRGLRRKSDEVPFMAYQIRDEAYTNQDHLIDMWQAVGLDAAPPQGFVVAPPNYIKSHRYAAQPLPRGAPVTPQAVSHFIPRYSDVLSVEAKLQKTLDIRTKPPEHVQETHTQFADIVGATAIDAAWLQKIFIHEGFTALVSVADATIGEWYPNAANDFVHEAVATVDDMPLEDAARELNTSIKTLKRQIDSNEAIATRMKYRRAPGGILRKVQHITKADILALQPTREVASWDDYIAPDDLATLLGKPTIQESVSFVKNRGFILEAPLLPYTASDGTTRNKPQHAFRRSEVAPWIVSYRNAEPLPEQGYRALRTIHRVYGISLAHACDIARSIDIAVVYFTKDNQDALEYVSDDDVERLAHALRMSRRTTELHALGAAATLASTTPSAPSPSMPSSTHVTEEPKQPLPQQIVEPQKAPAQAPEPLAAADSAPELPIATGETMTLRAVLAESRCNQSVIDFLLQNHPRLKGYCLKANSEGKAVIDYRAGVILRRIFQETSDLPKSWVFAGAIYLKETDPNLNLVHELGSYHNQIGHTRIACKVGGIPGVLVLTHCLPTAMQAVQGALRAFREQRKSQTR